MTTAFLIAGSLAIVFGLYFGTTDDRPAAPSDGQPPAVADTQPAPTTPPVSPATTTGGAADPATPSPQPATDPAPPSTDNVVAAPAADLGTFVVIQPDTQPEPVIGSDQQGNEAGYLIEAQFSPWNAGVISVDLAEHSADALEHVPYRVQSKVPYLTLGGRLQYYYPMGAVNLNVNGQTLNLSHQRWRVVSDPDPARNGGAATFELTVGVKADADSPAVPAIKVLRTWRVVPGRYDLLLEQKVVNLTDQPLKVWFAQFGPADLPYQPGYLGDQRRVFFGHVRANYPGHVFMTDSGVAGGRRATLIKKGNPNNADNPRKLWPTQATIENGYRLTYAAMTNQYFTAAVIPLETQPQEGRFVDPTWSVDNVFPFVFRDAVANGTPAEGAKGASDQTLLLRLMSPTFDLPAGADKSLDIAYYAGPKSPKVFADGTLYQRVGLDHLVIYETPCFLSFNSVALFLHWLLEVFHFVVRDWGVAIIMLTIVVRLILHPITKKSQLNMMRYSKQMQKIQPEIKKLKDKYKDDSQKLNQETMKLYREKGVNPAGMAMGCLPMFLQTPIWIALWAMLFFAIELRHTPAFFDLFHHLGNLVGVNWTFLTDLSSPDRFIALPEKYHFDIPLIGAITKKITSVNLLPILLIFTYWAQQKFMQPTSDPSQMTDQTRQQQKMMKYMMLGFPVMLFNAPCGLTLYMLASSISGIIDGKIVRATLKRMEDEGEFDKPRQPKKPKPGGFMDRMHKAAEERQRMMQQAQQKGGAGGRKKGKGKR